MAIRLRIRLAPNKDKFIIHMLRGIWPFRVWVLVKMPGEYNHSSDRIRCFKTYANAREFAERCAVDVVLEHKANQYVGL